MLASLALSLIAQLAPAGHQIIPSASAVDPSCAPVTDTSSVAGYTILSFTTTGTCTWTPPIGLSIIDSLVVVAGGGGGAGGYSGGGGGGAGAGGGGGVYSAASVAIPSSISIVVGTGGNGGGTSAVRNGNNGAQGSPSAFGTISAGGGGGGGCENATLSLGTFCTPSTASTNGGDGTAAGSGGGGSNYYNAYNAGGPGSASSATFNGNGFSSQPGFYGGYYNEGGSSIGNGAGPGGGARGSANYNTQGSGFTSNITGTSIEYGKGGGATGTSGWTFRSTTPGYGTGGDGQITTTSAGAAGAQGIVILRFKSIPTNIISIAGGGFTYRSVKPIVATPNLNGKLSFKANGKYIPGCKGLIAVANQPTTCSYKPSIHGLITVTVTLVPSDSGFATITTPAGSYNSVARSGNR